MSDTVYVALRTHDGMAVTRSTVRWCTNPECRQPVWVDKAAEGFADTCRIMCLQCAQALARAERDAGEEIRLVDIPTHEADKENEEETDGN